MAKTQARGTKVERPFTFLNLAMTADGKITTANRKFEAFSSRRDREHMLELRVVADAVMAGARTVDLNPVTMGPGGAQYRRRRLELGLSEYNLRVVVSGSGTLNPAAKIFETNFSPVIILTTEHAGKKRLQALRRRAQDVLICGESEIDFSLAMHWLTKKWGVKSLLCEGGGELDGALFHADLVDEVHLTICPVIFGGRAAPTIADGIGQRVLAKATPLVLQSAKRHGGELFLVYKVNHRPARADN